MMTTEAFLTASGAAYPHAFGNTSGGEAKRHASALYEIRIRNGKPESFRPAVLFAESLFLAPLLGREFDGLISKRTSAGRFEAPPTLPVRVRIEAGRFRAEPEAPSGFRAKVVLANLASPLTASDGSCMPSLASYGSQAPFGPGADVLVTVERVPSMHAFGNDELVFTLQADGTPMGSLMSPTWFFTPLDLVKNALALSGAYSGVGHGAPGSIPMLNLVPASGGGAACAP
jgi:hypothetical protein